MSIFTEQVTRTILVELDLKDVVNDETYTLRIANKWYLTEPDDTPANKKYYSVIVGDIVFIRELNSGNALSGRSIPDRGFVEFANTSIPGQEAGPYDELLDPQKYIWDGGVYRMYVVRDGGDFAEKDLISTGSIDGRDYTETLIRARLRGRQYNLDRLLQTNRYGGGGGADGNASIKGKPIPYAFGNIFNAEAVLIDPVKLIYQLNYDPNESISEVRVKGDPIDVGTSRADYSALDSNAPSAGEFDYTADLRYIRLGSQPDGKVTVDFEGSTLGGSYSALPGDIMNYVVETIVGISTINTDSITQLNIDVPDDIGLFIDYDINILDMFDEISNTYFGFHGFDRSGDFDVGIIKPPLLAGLKIAQSDIEFGTLQRQQLGQVVYRFYVSFKKNFSPQSQDELAGGLDAADKEAFSKLNIDAPPVEDTGILDLYSEAIEKRHETLFADEAGATRVGQRLLEFWGKERNLYTLDTANIKPLETDLNRIVELNHPRYLLSNGGNTFVCRLQEGYVSERVSLSVVGTEIPPIRIPRPGEILLSGEDLATNIPIGEGELLLGGGDVNTNEPIPLAAPGTILLGSIGPVANPQYFGTGELLLGGGAPTDNINFDGGSILLGGGNPTDNVPLSGASTLILGGEPVEVNTPVTEYVLSVQEVEITIAAGSNSNTATISSVDTATSVCFWNGFKNSDAIDDYDENLPIITLTNGTTVTAKTDDNDGVNTRVVNGTIVEFSSNMIDTIQNGEISIASASTSNTATISSITTSRTAVIVRGWNPAGDSSLVTSRGTAELTDATTVTARKAGTGSILIVAFTAIQFKAAVIQSIQQADVTHTDTSTTHDATISAVTMANTLTIHRGVLASGLSNFGTSGCIRCHLQSTTAIRFTRQGTSTSSTTEKGTAIEFVSGVVNSKQTGVNALTTSITTASTTVTAVNANKSLVNYQFFDAQGGSANDNDNHVCNAYLNTTTSVVSDRAASGDNVNVSFELMEFN